MVEAVEIMSTSPPVETSLVSAIGPAACKVSVPPLVTLPAVIPPMPLVAVKVVVAVPRLTTTPPPPFAVKLVAALTKPQSTMPTCEDRVIEPVWLVTLGPMLLP